MSVSSAENLKSKRCLPCEGGVPKISPEEAEQQLKALPGWTLSSTGDSIQKKWTVKNFVEGMKFLERVKELAEEEQHHPDVHLTGYKHVTIELSTHAISGLSENDFILAAKIDDLSVSEK